jgi:hypothetical protein
VKKALLILSSLPFFASAQIVNIPDANFKSELLAASPSNYTAQIGTQYVTIDTNGDGEIQQAEAAIITGLSLTSSNLVANFEGIQSFTAMTRFFVYDHNAAAIDFSGMTALKRLDLPDSNNPTPLNSLDLTGCTGLESLRVESTQLTSTAFLNAVPTLKELHFEFNPIVGGVLDVTGFPLLQILEYGPHYSVPGVLNASGLSALNELTITGSSELINSIDLSNCTALYFLNLIMQIPWYRSMFRVVRRFTEYWPNMPTWNKSIFRAVSISPNYQLGVITFRRSICPTTNFCIRLT